ncbi:MAG: gluconeogenesis factor YvcK family protein [bacterium]
MSTTHTTKIVTIGGGSGHAALLAGLRDLKHIDITAIVAMSDNGRSNGKLREELGILPVADILKCIIALSPKREMAKDLLLKKFKLDGKLNGYNAGYMMMAQLALFDNFENAVAALSEILEIKGCVIPVTLTRTALVTELEDGEILFGEYALDKSCGFYGKNKKIKNNFLTPHYGEKVEAYAPAIAAIKNADYIIMCPGGFYNSVMVNFLVPDVKDAILESSAKIIFISNMYNMFGSEKFTVKNYIEVLEERLGEKIDIIVANNFVKNSDARYEQVIVDVEDGWMGKKVIITDFEKKLEDLPKWDDSAKLAWILKEIIG